MFYLQINFQKNWIRTPLCTRHAQTYLNMYNIVTFILTHFLSGSSANENTKKLKTEVI